MSKDLAFNENANIAWDLHEANENIPLAFTEENNVELFGIEPAKAKEIVGGLDSTLADREVLKNAYIDVIELNITSENLAIFKELRLKLVKNRTSIETWHKNNKAFYLAGGRFVDAIKNKEIEVNKEMESKLLEGEKFFENQEKEKARLLNEERIEKVRPYVEDVTGLDFSPMNDEDFDDYVLGKKTRYNERIEAEKQMKIEAEKEAIILKLHNERSTTLLPYWNFILEADKGRNWGVFDEETFQSCLKMYQERKNVFDAENEKIRVENARLQKEAEEKELALQAERKLQADKEAKIKAENDAKLAEEKAKADKLQAELQAKKDAETKAENERLAKIEADKKAADKLLKAGQKKQIESWIETFQIEIPEHLKDDKIANDILSKFWSFKSWAKKEIENL